MFLLSFLSSVSTCFSRNRNKLTGFLSTSLQPAAADATCRRSNSPRFSIHSYRRCWWIPRELSRRLSRGLCSRGLPDGLRASTISRPTWFNSSCPSRRRISSNAGEALYKGGYLEGQMWSNFRTPWPTNHAL